MQRLAIQQKSVLMVAVMIAVFFAAVNMTVMSTSLPRIVSEIGGMEYFDWLFTMYMSTSTITAMLTGKLSDRYGRKLFLLTGIVLFSVGAFLCGTSATIYQLILYKGVQGVGGGMIMSSGFAVVGDLFAPEDRGRWQGLFSAVFGLSSLSGPTLGGYIVDHYAWPWVFWIFLPIGLLPFLLIWRLYPPHPKQEKEAIDYAGSLLLTTMIASFLLAFSWAGKRYAWGSLEIVALFSLTVISLVIFLIVEKRAQSPVLPLYLFKNNAFVVTNLAVFLLGMGMFGTIIYVPFYVQGVQGYSAATSGLVEAVMTVAMVLSGTIAGHFVTQTGKYKSIALIGLAIMASGLFLNAGLQVDSSLTRLMIQLFVVGTGLGINLPVFTVIMQNCIPYKHLGVATSLLQVFRDLGGTIGVSVMGTILSSSMKGRLEEPAPGEVSNMEALSFSLTRVFLLSAIAIAAALIVTCWLKRTPLKTSGEAETKKHDLDSSSA